MGCTSSREAQRELVHEESVRPLSRSYSLPFPGSIRSRRRRNINSTSSTPGSVKLDSIDDGASDDSRQLGRKSVDSVKDSAMSSAIHKARRWSEVIEMKITKSPPGDAETIDERWEHLGDTGHDPLRHFPGVERPFTSSGAIKGKEDEEEKKRPSDAETGDGEGGVVRPRKGSFVGLPPLSPIPAVLKEKVADRASTEKKTDGRESNNEGRIRKMRSKITAKFHEKIGARKAEKARAAAARIYTGPPGGQRKVVLYLTSLRGIRKTYEDCNDTLTILKGYNFRIDERDVSMHSGFKEELINILGPNFGGVQLPRIFANGQYLGGADEIHLMHENGKLSKAFKGCLPAPRKDSTTPCDMCGDMRFIPCEKCNGSCKIYVEFSGNEEETSEEEDEGEEEEEGQEEEKGQEKEEGEKREMEHEYHVNEESDSDSDEETGRFTRCPDCNENGLVRCPICCKE